MLGFEPSTVVTPNIRYVEEGSSSKFFSDTCPTGKEGNIWYLGEVGLDFNSGGPIPISGFANRAGEGYSSICDRNGNLVLYFDGRDIYNSAHQTINTSRLNSSRSTSQSLILNQPGADSLYFVFYSERFGDVFQDSSMSYAIIDVDANGGQGRVLVQDVRLIWPSSEKMTAVRHCNNRDWWIIGLETFSNRYYSFLLTQNGIDMASSKVSFSGWDKRNLDRTLRLDAAHGACRMKVSHDGSKLAVAYCNDSKDSTRIEVHDFNCQTGVVSNGQIVFDTVADFLYGLEFSPDNSKLYVGSYSMYQFDLWAGDIADIRASKSILFDRWATGEDSGGPTLGPNDKIYLTAGLIDSSLHIIHEPNAKGLACNFEYKGFDLGGRTSFSNINLPSGMLHPYRIYSRGPDTLCMDSTAWFYLTDPCPHPDLEWIIPQEAVIEDRQGDSILIKFCSHGSYKIIPREAGYCGVYSDTMDIVVKDCSLPRMDICPTGKEGHVWFLGQSGLDFNSGSAVERTGFAVRAGETQTSICDKDGNLLMYFDGNDLYDRSHNIMAGNNNIRIFGKSSTQSIFIKQPESDSLYFLFFTEAYTGGDPLSRDTLKRLFYVQVDLSLNGGLGEVISPKVSILRPSTEKVTVIPHCNNKDYWVIGSEGGSNRFFTWLLDKDSLHQSNPIVSSSGTGNDGIYGSKAGFLKPTHDGMQLAEVIVFEEFKGMLNLHHFNQETGVVSNGVQIITPTDGLRLYGCEFSPNNSKLYLTGYRVWQLDLWTGDDQDIRRSLIDVSGDVGNIGAPTLGPDGIIYITKFNNRNRSLFTIDAPDQLGLDCQFDEFGFSIQNGTGLGAPNFPAGFLFPERLYTRYHYLHG